MEILNIIIKELSTKYSDFKGLYFYGSRQKLQNSIESDYDVILLFEKINYQKELEIAGIINKIEYNSGKIIDYKIFSESGKKNIEYIRKNINPIFIKKSIDEGNFYGRI